LIESCKTRGVRGRGSVPSDALSVGTNENYS
jgi:hypothetical protein